MKRTIQKLIGLGVDLSTKKALKAALKILGIKPENVDKLYIELKNNIHKKGFDLVPPKDKIVFLPQCLRNSKKCKAKLTKYGYVCVECGACKVFKIKNKAEKLGYRVFIVPGGSMVLNIIKKEKPKAVLGVACINEIVTALEEIKIPTYGVELLRDGCVDTDVDLNEVYNLLYYKNPDKKNADKG